MPLQTEILPAREKTRDRSPNRHHLESGWKEIYRDPMQSETAAYWRGI